MRASIACLALTLALTACSSTGGDEVEWVDWGENPMANPEFGASMMEASAVTEQHQVYLDSVGTFTVDGKFWMGPNTPAMPMDATAKRYTVLGGRYVVEEFKSEFMGMPFEGMLVQGYDNLSGEYFNIWMDNFSTWPSQSRGHMDANGVMQMSGVMKDISTPGGRPTRSEILPMADGGATMSMYDTVEDGTEFKVMELHYKPM